jgi:hypothetical protein
MPTKLRLRLVMAEGSRQIWLQSCMPHEPTELIQFLAPYPPHVQAIALEARLRLHELVGPAGDLFYDATAAVCSGFCYTDKPADNFVNLAVYSDHVTLIFAWGARLIDPEMRLKGEGSRVRHIRLAGIDTLRDAYVVDLIRQAASQAVRPDVPIEPIKYVKVYRGKKRRPLS